MGTAVWEMLSVVTAVHTLECRLSSPERKFDFSIMMYSYEILLFSLGVMVEGRCDCLVFWRKL